jgi:hypothetical protein
MKKLLSIISAGAFLFLTASCVTEEQFVTFNNDDITAPVLNSYEQGEKEVIMTYTPGSFKPSFNQKMPTYHSVVVCARDGKPMNKVVSASMDGSKATVSLNTLNRMLIGLGIEEGTNVSLELLIRASIQSTTYDTSVLSYKDSESHAQVNVTVTVPKGSPYSEYTEDSNWTVIGALSAYGIDWNNDLNMWTDGNGNHVAAHVTLKQGDEFKFRQDKGWTVNLGGDFSGLDNEFSVTQDGPNIKVGADGVFDLFVNTESGIAWISAAYDPYPDFTETSNWSVIGSLYESSWGKDFAMISDGTNHLATGIELTADDEFKFRQDAGWTVNLGGEFAGLGAEFGVTQDGPNIKVGTAGVYDIQVNPEAGTAMVSEASGMKISSIAGGDEPEPGPEPVVVTGWNIIGLNGDWENDIAASETNGVWTAYITANDATEFKWRKDGGWDENYGGDFAAFGEPFEAVAGGNNIAVPAGFYKVVLDLSDASAPTITVFNDFEVWSLIGDFNGWAGDVDMVLTDGKWVATDVDLTPGWKIRKNHGWDENRGGAFAALGEPFEAVAGGDNIDCGTGKFTVVYDPEAETITISEGTVWSLIGDFNSWGGDVDMTLTGGKWVANDVELSGGWKLRKNHDWEVNRGGAFVTLGEPFEAVQGGDNIDCGEGKFNVVYDPAAETITVSKVVRPWSVIGDFNEWSADVEMTEVMPGIWISNEAITTEGGWKIRFDAGWDVNRGGSLSKQGEFCKAVQGGDNINLTGTFKVVYNANNETIGTLGWGVIGSIASAGISWDNDIPMNLGTDGKWYSIPFALTTADEFKIRFNADWELNFGGAFEAVETPFEAVSGGDNIKVDEDGTYMLVYDPEKATITLTKDFWGLIGNFNGWSGDVFMICQGAGVWAAYGQVLGADWKIRQACGWDVNRGGAFVATGEPFEAVQGGDNINAGDGTLDIVYNSVEETFTVAVVE